MTTRSGGDVLLRLLKHDSGEKGDWTQGFSRLFCIFIDKIKSSLPLLGLGVGAPGAPGGREDQEAGGEEDQGRGVPVAILFRGEGVNRTRGAAFL